VTLFVVSLRSDAVSSGVKVVKKAADAAKTKDTGFCDYAQKDRFFLIANR